MFMPVTSGLPAILTRKTKQYMLWLVLIVLIKALCTCSPCLLTAVF